MRAAHRSFCIGVPPDDNDDRVLEAMTPEGQLIAVADGVGGHFGGGSAASAALDILRSRLSKQGVLPLKESFEAAAHAIAKVAETSSDLSYMATTLTACLLKGTLAYIGHVGDTRAYHLRGAGLITRTKDQNEGAELVRQGVLTAQKSKTYRRRNALTSALSASIEYQLQEAQFEIQVKDRLVLMTDGAYSTLTKKELVDISLKNEQFDDFFDTLSKTVASRNPTDDFSAVALEILLL